MSELDGRFQAVRAAAAEGDAEAFGLLWQATHPGLLRYLRVLCGDAAEDVASEMWLKAIRGLGSFSGDEQGFRSWLVAIARNHVRDVQRRAARRPEVLSADPRGIQADLAPDAADEAITRWSTEQALKLIATLPPEQADMVALRVVVGLDVPEVAAIVGRSPGAVRVAVHRGLRRLAQQLAGEPPPPVTLRAVRR